ncbi:MAG: hypothetical protein Kow002_02230 [Anaerolineales bacterium]
MRTKNTPRLWTLCLLLIFIIISAQSAGAASSPSLTNNQATLNFPDSITFRAHIDASAEITSVVLEYGTQQLTCGTVIAKAFPQFTPGTSISPTWTWEMRQSGSLPPGATIWWRWRYTDATGHETISEQKTVTWLDTEYDWQTVRAESLNLHWYRGDQTFAQSLLDSASAGLARLENDAGLKPEKPIDLYIYGDYEDLRDAILYEPSWTGGLAFPAHDIVIIGISPSNLAWGQDAIVHELTHVLVGHLTFSCLGDVPTWLNEGLAVYSEGDLDPSSQNQLDQAISSNSLLSVRSLSAGFSEIADKASLSYSQSYSIVKFLIETYGQDKMDALLAALRDGETIDAALLDIYGFDVDGLEDKWRETIGAGPRTVSAQPTAQATPTYVPTYVPFSGAPLLVTPTPYGVPTSSLNQPDAPSRTGPPLSLTIMLAVVCCILFLLVGVIVLGVLLRTQKRKGENHETHV